MPPRVKVSKQDVLQASIWMVREKGENSLNARMLASYIGCSTQPIFSNFSSMEELKEEVRKAIYGLYLDYLKRELDNEQYPVYKAYGMGYIRFAKEEKELFKMLFMRDRSKEVIADYLEESVQMSVAEIQKNMGLSMEEAQRFHLEMWICVHGIASLLATSYLPLEWEEISNMVTDLYQGIRSRFA